MSELLRDRRSTVESVCEALAHVDSDKDLVIEILSSQVLCEKLCRNERIRNVLCTHLEGAFRESVLTILLQSSDEASIQCAMANLRVTEFKNLSQVIAREISDGRFPWSVVGSYSKFPWSLILKKVNTIRWPLSQWKNVLDSPFSEVNQELLKLFRDSLPSVINALLLETSDLVFKKVLLKEALRYEVALTSEVQQTLLGQISQGGMAEPIIEILAKDCDNVVYRLLVKEVLSLQNSEMLKLLVEHSRSRHD